ncbi:hypothetical protein EC991_002499 [Linnemannia zychae]|nr:hypothetical protein EC991_002499 [Linnemannia zychae]
MICRVEGKIRRTWADSGARLWKLRTEERRSPCKGISTNNFGPDTPSTSSSPSVASAATIAPHYSELIRQALASADTKHRILGLNNTELSRFLDITWSAFDGLISEQESWIQYTTTDSTPYNPAHPRSHSHTQAQCEALYPKLAKHLLEGNNHATIAAKTSDDDCEMIRLISEILYRQQLDLEAAGATSMTGHSSGAGEATSVHGRQKATKAPAAAAQAPSTKTSSLRGGRRATFEDYYAMQSNELVLFRQQIKEDLDAMEEQEEESEQDSEDEQEQDAIQDIQSEQQQQQQLPSRESKHDTDMAQWRQLLSILPKHLLSCFYVYLRIRDAYLLLARENATLVTANPDTPHAAPHQQQQQRPTITLQITSTLFRALLYREVANSFGIRDASDELLGFAVFPRACFFNHSCRPNILKKRRLGCKARQMEYWSTEFIQKGEECCISYGDILVGVEERRARLEDMYFFECSCPRCLEEAEK